MRGVWGTKATPYLLEGDLIGPSHAQKQLSPSPFYGRKEWTRGVGRLCDFMKRYQLCRQTWVPNPSSITYQLCSLGASCLGPKPVT